MSTASMQQRWDRSVMATYGTPPLAIDHGEGAVLTDVAGRDYIDLYAGIAVSALGHAHPAVVDAVTTQIRKLTHVSNLLLTEPTVALGERLAGLLDGAGGSSRVFLCNSGAEANEAAIKVARRFHPRRTRLVAAERGFHGRTLGALSITGQPGKRSPFEPLLPGVQFVPYGDVAALRTAVRDDVAAVFLEPVLGEAGVIPAPPGYLAAAREICDANGALLVLDEIQGGIGRAGAWFSHQVVAPGVRPDVVTLAKGLGGGLPIGACVATGEAAAALQLGDHGSTFGGNPVAAAAALAVLHTIEADGLLAAAAANGDRLADIQHPLVDHVRGLGLWRAVVLTEPVAAAVEQAARRRGVLVNTVAPDVLRLAPPLVISAEQIAAGLSRLRAACDDVLAAHEQTGPVGGAADEPGGGSTADIVGAGPHPAGDLPSAGGVATDRPDQTRSA